MRKVTASFVTSLAAVFAGLTSCGTSNRVPEWSFEAPAVEPGEGAYVAARAETSLPANDVTATDFEQTIASPTIGDRSASGNNVSSSSALARYAPTSSRVYLPASPPVGSSQVKPSANPAESTPTPIPKSNSALTPAPPADTLAARTVLAASAPAPSAPAPQARTQINGTGAAPTTADGLPLLRPSTADESIAQRSLSTAALSTADLKEPAATSEPDLASDPLLPATAPSEIAAPDLAMAADQVTARAIGTDILLSLQQLSEPATADATVGLATVEPGLTAPTLANLTQSLQPQDSVLLTDLRTALELSPATVNLWDLQQGLSKTALFDGTPVKLKAKDNLYYSAGYLYSPLIAGLRLPTAPHLVTDPPAVEADSTAE